MKREMVDRLWAYMGSNDPYFTLIRLNEAMAHRIEDAYAADYEAAPERDSSDINPIDAAMDPDYKTSKGEIIGAWAVEIQETVKKEYIAQYSAEELETMRTLLSRGGIEAKVTICHGVDVYWAQLIKED